MADHHSAVSGEVNITFAAVGFAFPAEDKGFQCVFRRICRFAAMRDPKHNHCSMLSVSDSTKYNSPDTFVKQKNGEFPL